MTVSRYELSDVQWSRIEGLLPGRVETVGRTAANNRGFVNGVLWVLRSGAHWHDLPERYGKYKSVHKRFGRWAAGGVWDKVFQELVRDRKNQYLMIDSTIVRAHQQAATGRKRGLGQGSGALPRRSDDQDSPAGQRTGPAGRLPRHWRPGQRLHPGYRSARSTPSRLGVGRQGLRQPDHPQPHRGHGSGRGDPF